MDTSKDRVLVLRAVERSGLKDLGCKRGPRRAHCGVSVRISCLVKERALKLDKGSHAQSQKH